MVNPMRAATWRQPFMPAAQPTREPVVAAPKPLPWSALSPRLRALWEVLRGRGVTDAAGCFMAACAEPLGYRTSAALEHGLRTLAAFGWAIETQPGRWAASVPTPEAQR